MPGNVTADIHDRVPATVAQRRVVAGVAVARQPGEPGEQARAGLAPAEQGHLGTGSRRIFDDGPAHEGRAAQHEQAHDR